MTQNPLNDGERIDRLVASQRQIIQNRDVFSFSVDSVLLARFPRLPQRGHILDLCAGNGAVGLLASTQTQAKITAIEIQERLADMTRRSIQLNGLEAQMSVITDNLKNICKHIDRSQVDLILCNPPYFKVDPDSHLNASEHYLLARHEITTNLDDICRVSQQVLKSNGRLAMVHRPERFLEILDTFRRYKLAPKRIQFVYPKPDKAAYILLIEAIKDGSDQGLKILPPLTVHKANGNYSDEIHELYYGK